ncbi:MAG TPA: protocatechuate 3,4-dioxygenase [Duganella sp.]|nr:protocatechuate 3,4-dioxygenase [Duganella sp.]
MSNITTSQTIGPFSHEAWKWATELNPASGAIIIRGAIYDGAGAPINDAQIESWQPAAANAEAAADLPGFRRVPSGEDGGFALQLSKVDQAPGEPVAYVTVFARGLVKHQFTAVFLADDAGVSQSAILDQVPAARRATLLAERQPDGSYRWDIHMQGERETVFFDYK